MLKNELKTNELKERLEVELFRFDVKIDLSSYYKPYIFESADFRDLRELLGEIKRGDPYFEFDCVKWVKVNGYLTNLDEKISKILECFDTTNPIYISPLIEKRAVKDLKINDVDFMAVFEKFCEISAEFKSELEAYKELKPLFYSSRISKFRDDFLGNSAFVFASHLLDKFPSKKEEILDFIAPWIPYFLEPKFLFEDPFKTKECVINLIQILGLNENFSDKDLVDFSEFKDIKSEKFRDFNIAFYGKESGRNFIKNLANLSEFDLQDEELNLSLKARDNTTFRKLLSEILFDAYDSGADFLVVNNESFFKLLDDKTLAKVANRNLENFYILRSSEFIDILNGKKPDSLKNHSLEVPC